MTVWKGVAASAASVLLFACAPLEEPGGAPQDPAKEQIVTLQKQLLELQRAQNETKTQLEESLATIDALNAKISELESRRAVRPAQPVIETAPAPEPQITPVKKPAKKKPVKKKKKQVKKKPQARPKPQQPAQPPAPAGTQPAPAQPPAQVPTQQR